MFKKDKKRNLAILVASIMCMSAFGFSSVSAMEERDADSIQNNNSIQNNSSIQDDEKEEEDTGDNEDDVEEIRFTLPNYQNNMNSNDFKRLNDNKIQNDERNMVAYVRIGAQDRPQHIYEVYRSMTGVLKEISKLLHEDNEDIAEKQFFSIFTEYLCKYIIEKKIDFTKIAENTENSKEFEDIKTATLDKMKKNISRGSLSVFENFETKIKNYNIKNYKELGEKIIDVHDELIEDKRWEKLKFYTNVLLKCMNADRNRYSRDVQKDVDTVYEKILKAVDKNKYKKLNIFNILAKNYSTLTNLAYGLYNENKDINK